MTAGAGRRLVALYTLTVFASAWLLFMVEPMVGKMLLPLVGGAAAVWTTSLLFFQALLLAGYAWAHFAATRLSLRLQGAVQLAIVAVAALTLPIQFSGAGLPHPGTTPTFWVLGTLLTRVGPTFFCLTTLSPLLQSWFSRSGHPGAAHPYFLYRASNLGSFGALVTYPLLVERFAGINLQTRAWQVGYVLLLVLLATTAVQLWRTRGSEAATQSPAVAERDEQVRLPRLARWTVLATVPSLWMLAVTVYFTTQVRPIPLLWVIPLALYLLSFVVVFSRRPLPLLRLARAYPYVAVVLLGLLVLGGNRLPFLWGAALQFGAFFLAALICHGQLAADRPAASRLTVFYLALAVGGALGGLLGAIVAPAMLPDLFEFPLAIVAVGLLLPRAMPQPRAALLREVAAATALAVVLLALGTGLVIAGVPARLAGTPVASSATVADLVRLLVILPIPAVAAVAFSRRPAGLGVVLMTIFGLTLLPLGSEPAPLYLARDFYGVHRVRPDAQDHVHIYQNNGVIHGVQFQDPATRDIPTTYYSPGGPAGDVLHRALPGGDSASIAVIGLGAGSLACNSRPGQSWVFYEIDPEVVRIARDPRLFTLLRDCTPRAQVVVGDGRLEVSRAAPRSFDLIMVDAFGGDAPPVHVMTREAIAMYLERLRPGGYMVFNTSNAYVDFRTVLAATGSSLGLQTYDRVDATITPEEERQGKTVSQWTVLAPADADLGALPTLPGWQRIHSEPGGPVWTDDYSNLLSVLRLF